MRASTEEITAMKARLSARQEQRRFDRDADEAIRMVHHRQPLVVEERVTAVEKRERQKLSAMEAYYIRRNHRRAER